MTSMDDEDAADLLQHIRATVRERGLADLDGLVLASDVLGDRDPVGRVTAYLRALRDQVRLGTEQSNRALISRFEGVRTQDGRPMSGIEVQLTGADAQIYGRERIDLVGSPELDEWLSSLEALVAELEESRD